jgi:hypothetical protein
MESKLGFLKVTKILWHLQGPNAIGMATHCANAALLAHTPQAPCAVAATGNALKWKINK